MMKKLKKGLSLANVQKEKMADFLNLLIKYKIGLLEVHPHNFPDEATVEIFTDRIREKMLKVFSVHVPFGENVDISSSNTNIYKNGLDMIYSSIQLAQKLDAECLVIHASYEPISDCDRQERINNVKKAFCEVYPAIEEAQKRIAVEILPRSCLGNSIDEVLELVLPFPAHLFGACLDVNHVMNRYKALPDYVKKLGTRLFSLHISDYDGIDEKHWLPQKGVIEWQPLASMCRSVNSDAPWIYECCEPIILTESGIVLIKNNLSELFSTSEVKDNL